MYMRKQKKVKNLVSKIFLWRLKNILLSQLYAEEIRKNVYKNLMSSQTRKVLQQMSESEIAGMLENIMSVPINFSDYKISGDVYRTYFVFCWQTVFQELNITQSQPLVLEIASGQSDPVPQALEIYSRGSGTYVTANLNKELTRGMLKKTDSLETEIEIIEDNAGNLEDYCRKNKFSLAAFQHAVNDMIQTIAAHQNNIDTVNNDWYDILPKMIEIVDNYFQKDKLKDMVYEDFIEQIRVCSNLVEKDGFLVFNTHVFQMDLEAGYSRELYKNFINLARKWILKSDLPLIEKDITGFEKQWWLFLQKI